MQLGPNKDIDTELYLMQNKMFKTISGNSKYRSIPGHISWFFSGRTFVYLMLLEENSFRICCSQIIQRPHAPLSDWPAQAQFNRTPPHVSQTVTAAWNHSFSFTITMEVKQTAYLEFILSLKDL